MLENYRNILAPIDGSKQSETALKKAITIAERNQAKVTVAHIIDLQYLADYEYRQGEAELRRISLERGTQLLEQYKQEYALHDSLQIEYIVKEGTPKHVISTDLVKEHNIDLIVIGATGTSGIEKFFIGSTTDYVSRKAECDILIVHAE